MEMKRSLALLLALLMSLSLLAGCGNAPAETGKTDTAQTQTGAPAAEPTPEPPPAVPEDEWTLEREAGCRQLTLYWTHPSADYDKCDVWLWFPGRDGSGNLFHPCAYGAKCVVNVPEDVSEVGFIVRRDCSEPGGKSWGDATKDVEEDRFAIMTSEDTRIYLKPGDSMQYTSADGGATLEPIRTFSMAGILSPTEIQYFIAPATEITSLDQVHVREGEREVEIAKISSLGNKVITGVIEVKEELDVSKDYTVEIEAYGTAPAIPTGLFDSPAFIEKYTYDGDDLGAVIDGEETTFKLWAPTCSKVVLDLYEAGDGVEAYDHVDMVLGEKGVWSATVPCGHGTYYTYTVTNSLGTQTAVDPYAKAVGVNGNRGMVIDLAGTDPEGFRDTPRYEALENYGDAVIWEVHVRDFSNLIASSQYPGKYLAFTETGLVNEAGLPVGVDYLKELGITHVHLQPVYDYATVDESSDAPQFNWGYDPKNYNAPEGSYSTDPYHGEVRVTEFKQMVQALHEAGIGVVMDMVYNHTFSLDSNLNKIVPYYYYRFGSDGSPSNGSGCGNETASERTMFRKYMVESVRYWAEEYQLDGFRFDLMALHDLQTMQEIEQAVHEVDPHAILYGEGWTGGTSALRENDRASQANIRQIQPTGEGIGAIAVFNDAIRDGLKGSVFDVKDCGYINGKVSKLTAGQVAFGIAGGVRSATVSWYVDRAMVINYVSAHDNNTLWDKLLLSCPDATDEERLAMNRMAAQIVLLSKGTPFFLAGEEMLRTTDGDHNSYASSDKVNNIDWSVLTPESEQWKMAQFYRDLIAMRRANAFFAHAEQVETKLLDGGAIEIQWRYRGKIVAYGLIAPTADPVEIALPDGSWTVLLKDNAVYLDGGETLEGTVSVSGQSVLIVKR